MEAIVEYCLRTSIAMFGLATLLLSLFVLLTQPIATTTDLIALGGSALAGLAAMFAALLVNHR